jgi:hypothetical protein
MMSHLLAKIRTNQERTGAKLEAMQEKMVANLKEMRVGQEHLKEGIMVRQKTQIGCLASRLNINQETAEACHREKGPSRKDAGHNTLHSVPVRGVNKASGGRRPGMCRPKDAGPPKGT